MHIFNYVLKDKKDISLIFKQNFPTGTTCFFDIETTGLNRANNSVYLIGFLYFDANSLQWTITQCFAESIDEEKQILQWTNNFISNFKTLITFNGESFDIPFIKYRMDKYGIKNNFDKLSSFDIYKEVKKHHSYLNFKNYRLKTIEENLGIYREDKLSGKECINLYFKYMRNKEKDLVDKILKHNYDDLYYLIDILKIFDNIYAAKSFHVQKDNDLIEIQIEDIFCDGDMFNIYCKTSTSNNIAYYGEHFNIRWEDKRLFINFEYRKGMITPTKECLFIDVSSWDIKDKLKDLSEYLSPENVILLKVEDIYEIYNIKNIIEKLILVI